MRIITLLVGAVLSFNISAQPIIEFVVSAAVGGPADNVTRKLVEKLEKDTSLKFVVFNKPGAAHQIGYNYVISNAKPTLIISTPEITSHEAYSKLDEIYNLGYFTNILFVSKKSNIQNFKQLTDLSKTREIIFGHGGVGTYSHRAMQTLCEKTLKCLDVAYKGGSPGILAVMSGEIDVYALTSYGIKQFLENNMLVPIYATIPTKEKSWVKLFAKNVSKIDQEIISNVLKSQDFNFYADMGFEK
jgi:tripartite-type tricarboxylate transporter receptor subunit TctC